MKRIILVLLVATACGRPQVTGPVPATVPVISGVREFEIPWENAFPSDVVVDSAGRVWFTDRLVHGIGRFDPVTSEFTRYATPTRRSTPYGLLAAPDGTLWYAAATANGLGRIDPATGEIIEYPIPGARGGPQLLAWWQGEIWFSLREGMGYGRFDTRTGESTLYPLENLRPYSVTATASGIWFSLYQTFRLLQVDPASGEATVHDMHAYVPVDSVLRDRGLTEQQLRMARQRWGALAMRVAADARGRIWFTDFGRGRVFRFEPATQSLHWVESLEQRSEPYGIAVGSDGLVWWGEKGTNRIVVLDPVRDERVRVRIQSEGGVIRNIAIDEARGRVWLPMSDRAVLGLIDLR
jgi:virginiamycin B lyase